MLTQTFAINNDDNCAYEADKLYLFPFWHLLAAWSNFLCVHKNLHM
jgi:hypothetical protein